ncbi:hypothetical protein PL81_14615 [Streptomyces sp. RSD-27]|nr:hypothetical protein PL81_14615 [Streptomyces sp. RSD-27]
MYSSRPAPGRLAAGIAATLVVFVVLLMVVLLSGDDDLPACPASRSSGMDIVVAGPRPCVLHGLTTARGGAAETAPAGQNGGGQGPGSEKQQTTPKAPPRKELAPPKAPPAPAAPRPAAPAPKSR